MSVQTQKISVVVNVKNMAEELALCLKSAEFADEIIVVDMESTDKTVSVAKKYTDKVYSHPDIGYADPARNFALSKAKNDWILVLDADETVSPTLQLKIQELVAEPQADVYWLPRQNIVFGTWLNKAGWWPDHQPRLFRKNSVAWAVGVHRMPDITGQQLRLPPKPEWAILHQNYTSIEQFLEKLNQYTSLQAAESAAQSEQAPLTASQQDSFLKAYFDELLKRWLAQRGIDGGLHGTAMAFLQANYELVKQLKLWQIAGFPATESDQKNAEVAVRRFQSELNYWLADWHLEHSQGFGKLYWWVRRKLRK
jgi:hypothetical protein